MSVLWAYDGRADLSFAAGEVKDPQRNPPLVATFVVNSIINDTTNSVITFAVILAGLPVHHVAFATRTRRR